MMYENGSTYSGFFVLMPLPGLFLKGVFVIFFFLMISSRLNAVESMFIEVERKRKSNSLNEMNSNVNAMNYQTECFNRMILLFLLLLPSVFSTR